MGWHESVRQRYVLGLLDVKWGVEGVNNTVGGERVGPWVEQDKEEGSKTGETTEWILHYIGIRVAWHGNDRIVGLLPQEQSHRRSRILLRDRENISIVLR